MSWLPDGDRSPSGGERLDGIGRNAVNLAFRALDRFPEIVKRHKYIAGGAAISSSLIALAGVAVARRMLRGATADEAVAAVTEEELTGLHLISDRETVVEDDGAAVEVEEADTDASIDRTEHPEPEQPQARSGE
jgi:hypothetical protein